MSEYQTTPDNHDYYIANKALLDELSDTIIERLIQHAGTAAILDIGAKTADIIKNEPAHETNDVIMYTASEVSRLDTRFQNTQHTKKREQLLMTGHYTEADVDSMMRFFEPTKPYKASFAAARYANPAEETTLLLKSTVLYDKHSRAYASQASVTKTDEYIAESIMLTYFEGTLALAYRNLYPAGEPPIAAAEQDEQFLALARDVARPNRQELETMRAVIDELPEPPSY